MSSTEQPIHAPLMPSAQPRHHLQKGDAPRIRLGGGPFVDTHTLAQLHEWHQRGASYGELIDRLTIYAVSTGFDPVSRKTTKPKKGK